MRHVIGIGLTLTALSTLVPSAVPTAGGEPLRDGRRFDPGAVMTERAPSAPEELDRLTGCLGHWSVSCETLNDTTVTGVAEGQAEITFMNRGHALLERRHCPDLDGTGYEEGVVAFIVFNPTNDAWLYSEANSLRETVSLSSGRFEGETLVLEDVERRLGGATLTRTRTVFKELGEDRFVVEVREITDRDSVWTTTARRTYRRRAVPSDLFTTATPYGSAAPDRPEAAKGFDFLIGEWDEVQDMTFPDGRNVRFPSNGTAVHILNGRAILEYSWYDIDTTLPDAATTIVRIYNRAMRRWECMYSTNRFNGVLRFGGVQEGDTIILHQFGANRLDSPMSYWVFENMAKDSYRWHAETSRDLGETFTDTWTIDFTRKN